MARGSRKTPPPPNRSPIVTRSHSNDNIPPQTTTTSTNDPQITVEPSTPNPTGGDIQEIVRQSLIKTHSALARLRQPNRSWGQPLDFSDIREQLGDTNPTVNPSDPILNPTAGGSGIPPSPPPSSPSSSGGDSSDEGNSLSQPSTPTTPVSVRSHSWIACRSRAQRPSVLCHDLFMKGDQMEITALGGITLTQGLSLVHKDRGGLES
jgi:hypothetical protein